MTPTKRPSTQLREKKRAGILTAALGKYSLAALIPEVIAAYRDDRLAGSDIDDAKSKPRSNNTVWLELALLGPLFNVAIREWGRAV